MSTRSISLRHAPADLQLIATLNRRGQPVLRVHEDRELLLELFGHERPALAAIRRLARHKSLVPVRRGSWAVRSERGTFTAGALELIGWLTPAEHLVSAGAALARHGLTDQVFRSIIVAVASPQREWSWLGERVLYREVSAKRLWGQSRSRSSHQGAKTKVASAEKTFLDCLSHPGWGVTIPQAAQALDAYLSRKPGGLGGSRDPLLTAARRYHSQAVAQRLGYLVELVAGPGVAETLRPLVRPDATPVLLANGSHGKGVLDRRWRVMVNVPPEALLEHRRVG